MPSFDKDCPVCRKNFTSLLEYTTHLGKDHRNIPTERILDIDKEKKWSVAEK